MLDKIRRKDSSKRVSASKESCRNPVKSHSRNACLLDHPLFDPRQVEDARSKTGKSARDRHRQDDVSLLTHTAVFCGIFIKSCRFQLISQFCLLQENPHEDGDHNSQDQAHSDELIVGKQFIKPQCGEQSAPVHALDRSRVRRGLFLYLCKQHVHAVKTDPVEHNAGNHFVYIKVCLEETGYGSDKSGRDDCRYQADIPRHLQAESKIQTCSRSDHILSGGADVKKPHFPCKKNGKRTHQKGRRLDQSGPEIFRGRDRARIVKEIL